MCALEERTCGKQRNNWDCANIGLGKWELFGFSVCYSKLCLCEHVSVCFKWQHTRSLTLWQQDMHDAKCMMQSNLCCMVVEHAPSPMLLPHAKCTTRSCLTNMVVCCMVFRHFLSPMLTPPWCKMCDPNLIVHDSMLTCSLFDVAHCELHCELHGVVRCHVVCSFSFLVPCSCVQCHHLNDVVNGCTHMEHAECDIGQACHSSLSRILLHKKLIQICDPVCRSLHAESQHDLLSFVSQHVASDSAICCVLFICTGK